MLIYVQTVSHTGGEVHTPATWSYPGSYVDASYAAYANSSYAFCGTQLRMPLFGGPAQGVTNGHVTYSAAELVCRNVTGDIRAKLTSAGKLSYAEWANPARCQEGDLV